MPYGCITSNISQGSVGTVDVSTAVANAPNEACLSDSATGDGSARILELDDEPAAYVHAHTMDIDAKHNSKAIEISTKTVSEQLKGMELLRRLRPVPEKVTSNPQLKIDLSDAVLAELEMTAAKLYFRTDSLFPPLEGQPMVTFSTQDKRGDPLGTYIETMATTPMACPLHVAAEILWKGTTRESQDPEKVPKFVRAKCYNTLARSCKLDMCNAVRIDGINFVRRYIELNRVVLVSAAAWFLPMEGIHFQDNVWTIVSRSPVDPLNASVIQSFCQFGAQVSVATSTPKEVYAPVQEYVRGTVGTKLRHLQEKQQRFLLEYGLAPVDTGIC
ncbi:hypothetical protein PRIC2_004729 [Phytophthora ramorum]|uniref:uncharacterized protein n=1 Tax=Phytophthora ramorum TaxID=164328 RepID=UPI0030B5F816|nr:hypothetical protein KRP23_4624 [Phytophthora ramorum]